MTVKISRFAAVSTVGQSPWPGNIVPGCAVGPDSANDPPKQP